MVACKQISIQPNRLVFNAGSYIINNINNLVLVSLLKLEQW